MHSARNRSTSKYWRKEVLDEDHVVQHRVLPERRRGAERSVQFLAQQLLANGHQPIVVCTAPEDRIDFVNGVKVYYLNNRNLYWSIEAGNKPKWLKPVWHVIDNFNPLMKRRIDEILAEERPDVIHSNNLAGFSMAPWVSAKESGIPVVHTLRDYNLVCSKSTMFSAGQNCASRCGVCKVFTEFKRTLTNKGYVQHVVGISQFMINKHQEVGYFNGVESSRIFNGVEISQTVGRGSELGETTGGRRLRFLYMGRVESPKGVDTLLNVFNEQPHAELYLAGRIHDAAIAANQEQGRYAENIRFLGFVNPNDVIPEMDVLIIPSLWNEPFGRVIIEAYAHGKPVIGTQRGGIPEIIRDGVTGFLYEPNRNGSLKVVIDKLIKNPEMLQEVKDNLAAYLSEFDIRKIADEYLSVYERVCQ